MNNSNGALEFDAVINNTNFKKQLDQMASQIRGLSATTESETKRMDAGFSKLGVAIGGALSFTAARQFVSELIQVRGQFQQLDIAFRTMLGNKEKSDALMAQIIQTAATTPFQLTEVAQGAKQLLAYGTAAEEVNGTLIRLGNIASGLSVPLNDLIYLYGTSATQGRLMTMDLNQFAGRGVPIYAELAKVMGVAKEQIKDLAAEGKIGFENLKKVVENLTNEGGMFYNLMAAQSKSLSGQISNLGDAWDRMLNDIGQSNEGVLSGSIAAVSKLVENYETVGKILVSLIATYGTYRAALIATNVLNGTLAISTGVYSVATRQLAVSETMLATAQAALNKVMSANPYVLVATAVAGLATAIWILHDSTTAQERAQKELNDEAEKTKQRIDELKAQTSELNRTIQDENATQFAKIQAFQKLQALYPALLKNMTLQQYLLMGVADAQKATNAELDKMKVADAIKNYEAVTATLKELQLVQNAINSGSKTKEETEALQKWLESGTGNLAKEIETAILKQQEYKTEIDKNAQAEWEANAPVEEKIKHYQQIKKELESHISLLQNDLLLVKSVTGQFGSMQRVIDAIRLDSLTGQLGKVQSQLNDLTGVKPEDVKNGGNKAYWEKVKKDAKDKIADMGVDKEGTQEWNVQVALVNKATRAIEKYNVVVKETKAAKIDTPFPSGSLAEIDRQIKKAEDAISKIPTAHIDRIKAMQETILALQKQRVEAEKIVEVSTWEETLDKKRQQYAAYEQALTTGYKTLAKYQYAELIKEGETYIEFLQKKLIPLEQKIASGGTLSKEEGGQYLRYVQELQTALGKSTAIEDFTKKLDNAKEASGSLVEYIRVLQDELDSINHDTTSVGIAQQKELQTRITATNKELEAQLKQFLLQVKGSEQQRQAIINRYKDLRVKAHGKELDEVNKAEKKALKDFEYENSQEFKNLNKVILGDGRDALLKRIKVLEEAVEKAKEEYGESSDEAKAKINKLNDEKNQLQDFDTRNWLMFADAIGKVGAEMEGLGGTLGSIGSLLGGMAGQAGYLADSLRLAKSNAAAVKNGGKADIGATIGTAAQGIGSLVSMIVSASQERKFKKNAAAMNLLSFQIQMNAALNEEIRLRTILNENVYFADYAGRIRDSIDAASDALIRYNDALNKLMVEGQARTGIKDVVNWSAVGAGALTGAGTGAAIGSAVGPVGTVIGAAVGAVVGAVVGLFSKKTKDLFDPLLQQFPELIDANGEFNDSLAQTLIATNQVDDRTKVLLQDAINMAQAYKEAKEQITDIVAELTGNLGTDLRDTLVKAFEDGTDAAHSFADTVEKTLENALSNLIYSAVFSKAFTKLQEDLEGSLLGANGKSFQEAFADFLSQSDELTEAFNDAIKIAQEEGKRFGFDLFSKSGSANDPNSLAGAVKGVTEDTASIIAGQMNAIRINQAETQTIIRQQLLALSDIANNTRYNSLLVSIEKSLRTLSNPQWYRDNGIA